jgi:hypothetical protein
MNMMMMMMMMMCVRLDVYYAARFAWPPYCGTVLYQQQTLFRANDKELVHKFKSFGQKKSRPTEKIREFPPRSNEI